MVDSFSSQSIKKNIHIGGLGMLSALGYSCLVHITRVDHQGISNRHDFNCAVRKCSGAKVFKSNKIFFINFKIAQINIYI